MNNKKRILLVEDDPNFGIILRDFLKMNEYDVILAKNGMEAVSYTHLTLPTSR